MATSHCKEPFILYLLAKIKIHLCYQNAIISSWQWWSPWAIWSSHIGTSVKMTEFFLRSLTISTCKCIRIDFGTYSINSHTKVMVCNSSISSLNSPQRLRQPINCSWWIIDYLCSIKSKSHPMQRVMSSITNINSNFSKLCFKYRMSALPFHIICGLIKISNSRNMPFYLSANNISMIINYHSSVMEGSFIFISL